jgi:hypothetical protein
MLALIKFKFNLICRELGLQEAMSVMKNEDVSVTHSKIKTMQEEINSFK